MFLVKTNMTRVGFQMKHQITFTFRGRGGRNSLYLPTKVAKSLERNNLENVINGTTRK